MTGPERPETSSMSSQQTTGWPQTSRPIGPAGNVPPSPGGLQGGGAFWPGTLGSMGGGAAPGGAPMQQPSVEIVSYQSYADAQRAVDYLSDRGFPVQNTSIVGTNLHLVEQVLGRWTTGRAAMSGAGAGAWLGLLIGLLFGLFSVGSWLAVVVAAVLIGAVWGAIFGAVAHAATSGQRDFNSRSRLEASQYGVNVIQQYAEDARRLLMGLPGSS